MALLSKKKQLVSVIETVSGTTPAGAFTSSANANVIISAAEPSFEVDNIERDFLRDTLTTLKGIQGQKTTSLSVEFELTGNSDDTFASGPPSWSKFLEMSGYRRAQLRAMRMNATTGAVVAWDKPGPIRAGEAIYDDAGLNYAIVAVDCYEGDPYIFYEDGVRVVIGDALAAGAMIGSSTDETAPGAGWISQDTGITFSTATSSGTASTETDEAGWAWIPVSEPLKKITLDAATGATVSIGDVYEGATSGAILVASTALSATDTEFYYRDNGAAVTGGEALTFLSGSADAGLTAHASPDEQYTQWPSGSLRLNEDGVYTDIEGSRGSFSWELEVNRPVKCTFTPRGRWGGSGDAVAIASTAELIDPNLWGGSVSIMAPNEGAGDENLASMKTPCLKSLSFDTGVELSDVKCSAADDGLGEIIGSGRNATGSLTANATIENDIPWLTALRSGEVQRGRFVIGSHPVGLNSFVFDVPAMQYTGISSGDDAGQLTRAADFSLNAGVIDNLDPVAASVQSGRVFTTRGDNEIILRYIVKLA